MINTLLLYNISDRLCRDYMRFYTIGHST